MLRCCLGAFLIFHLTFAVGDPYSWPTFVLHLLRFSGPIVRACKAISDFGEALTEADISNEVLRLAAGTHFLGRPSLGSALFVRPCYADLWKIIPNHAAADRLNKMVVTGTPGVGKSVFAFDILYHIRCKGTAVVFNHKQDWYRFSDSGVEMGGFYSFMYAGYFSRP